MCIALQSYSRAGDEPPEYRGQSWQMSTDYRRLTAQCLMLSDVTQPTPYTVETLLLHTYADNARSCDAEVGINISVTMLVRLAMRMGYHRDPAPYPVITPFQAEMRRRVWTAVRRSDILFNQQVGLPPVIRPRDTNVALPRNIYDDELFEEMTSLPPSRPTEEITPTSYIIANARLTSLLGEIIDDVQGFTNISYEDVMKYDQRLKEFQACLPPHLIMRSMKDSARDSTNLILQRYSVDLLYLKGVVTLHRKFLAQSRVNSRFAYSRSACLDASLKILDHQVTLHQESQVGGRLRNVKWFISSLNTNDFLLAGMITCLDLYHTMVAERAGRSPPGDDGFMWTSDRREEMFVAIQQSFRIWESRQNQSMEAYKGATTLKIMCNILKSNNAFGAGAANSTEFSGASGGNSNAYGIPGNAMDEDPNVAPEHSAAMTLGMLSTGGALSSNTSSTVFDNGRNAYPSPNTQSTPMSQRSAGLTPNFSLSSATSGPSPTGTSGISTTPDLSSFVPELRKGTAAPPSFSGGLFGGGNPMDGSGFAPLDPSVAAMNNMGSMPGAGTGSSGQDINWEAFDSFIQGSSALDPGTGMWGLDMGGMAPFGGFGGDAFGMGSMMGQPQGGQGQQNQQGQGGQNGADGGTANSGAGGGAGGGMM